MCSQVAQQCKENIYAIQTLRDFQYFEDGKDPGLNVREKAKQLGILLKDEERLRNERARALKAKERFAQAASAFGSDVATVSNDLLVFITVGRSILHCLFVDCCKRILLFVDRVQGISMVCESLPTTLKYGCYLVIRVDVWTMEVNNCRRRAHRLRTSRPDGCRYQCIRSSWLVIGHISENLKNRP